MTSTRLGVPGERREHVDELAALVAGVRQVLDKDQTLEVSINPAFSKAPTPYERAATLRPEEVRARFAYLRSQIPDDHTNPRFRGTLPLLPQPGRAHLWHLRARAILRRSPQEYLIGYAEEPSEVMAMTGGSLLERARRAAGLSQQDLARRAHTSRTTVSAYENDHKSPSLATAERLLAEAGHELHARPRVTFHRVAGPRGPHYEVPDRLPQLPPEQALATVQLPVRLNWSDTGRTYRMADRSDRARVYEAALREGTADDILAHVDGALLVDLWSELVLPRTLRAAWSPAINRALANQ